MISKEQFIEKVREEVFPQLLATESERIRTLYKGGVWIIFGFIILSFLLLLEGYNNKDGIKICQYSICLACLFSLYRAAHIWDKYVHEQKKKFTPSFLKFLGHLKYGQTDIDIDLLQHSCLFPPFKHSINDDCISGFLGKTRFSLTETDLLIYNLGGVPLMYEKGTIFRGICIYIPLKRSISGYTLLFNTSIPQHFPDLEKITLDYISFRKNYRVYSSDQIEARTLLTPSFMEKLNTLKKRFNNKRIDVSFWSNHVLFAIHTTEDLFEPYSLFKSTRNVKTYEKFYDGIKAIDDIIRILTINNQALSQKGKFNKRLYEKISWNKKSQEVIIDFIRDIGLLKLFRKRMK